MSPSQGWQCDDGWQLTNLKKNMYGSLTKAPQLPSLSEDSHNKVIPLWKVADYTVFLWGKTFPIQYLLCPVFIMFSGCDDTNIILCLLDIIQLQWVKIKIKYCHTGHWSTTFQDISEILSAFNKPQADGWMVAGGQ